MSLRRFSFICLAYYLFFAIYWFYGLFLPKSLEITFFDVGQGDSILISTPNRKSILIDGGPTFEVDRLVFEKFGMLNCKFDLVVLTHPHNDHVAGLNRLIQRCEIISVLYVPVEYGSQAYAEWTAYHGLAREHRQKDEKNLKLHVLELYSGQQFSLDGIDFYVLWPKKDFIDKKAYADNVNNTSVVLLLDFKDFEALFTGDAEKEVLPQIDLKAYLPLIEGKLEILKVPHQGAFDGLDYEFLRLLQPQYAIVSVGENNSYGHPDQRVLNYLESLGSKIYRTDMHGNINFKL